MMCTPVIYDKECIKILSKLLQEHQVMWKMNWDNLITTFYWLVLLTGKNCPLYWYTELETRKNTETQIYNVDGRIWLFNYYVTIYITSIGLVCTSNRKCISRLINIKNIQINLNQIFIIFNLISVCDIQTKN